MPLVQQEKISGKISFNLESKQSNVLEINTYCTDVTCSPLTNQLIDYSRDKFEYLTGLDFADDKSHEKNNSGLLIGSVFYWSFITDKIKSRNKGKPVTVNTHFRWF